VHDPSTAPTFAGIVSPVKLKAVWPAVKLFVEAPTHEPVAEPAALMNMFVSVSVKFAPVSATEFGLVIVKLIWLVPPTAMVDVTNAFAIVGAAYTVRLAVFDTAPVAAWALATPLAVLGRTPGVLDVTVTLMVQVPAAGIVNPVKLKAVWPFVREFEPPQTVMVCAPATLILTKVSVKFAPVSATEFGLVMVKLMVEVAPAAMADGEKAFAIAGDCAVTVRLAVFDTPPVAAWALATPLAVLGCVPGVLL
jgi:hypothetical protein